MRSLGSLAALVVVVAVGFALLKAGGPDVRDVDEPVTPRQLHLEPDVQAAAVERLARVLSFPTVASSTAPNHIGHPAPFQQLHEYLQQAYPLVYEKLEHERVNEYSVLFTWRGSRPELRPLLSMSHLDVVPAPTEGPGNNWTYPPFSGTVAEGYIWGRGALDIKVTAVQQLEAVSQLLRQGFVPTRTLYLAFGHDEEVGGSAGAGAIAALLQSRGVELELVLDEGGLVMMDGLRAGQIPLVEQPLALIGTAEKGFETWEVTVRGTGGHSSMPPMDGSSVASRIARILAALDAYPTTTRLAPPTTDWLRALAPAVTLAPLRVLLASADNWIVNPVLGQLLGQAGRALSPFVRTTCSVVKVQAGGIADNVLPPSGTITLNFRTLPGQGSDFIEEYLQMVTRKEAPHVSLRKVPGESVPATEVAPTHGPHYQLLKQAILETLQPPQGLRVAPFLLVGMTDSRHYASLAGGRVYLFSPHRYTMASIDLVHAVDERIEVEDFLRGIGFYHRIFELASSDESSTEATAAAGGAAGAGGAAATA